MANARKLYNVYTCKCIGGAYDLSDVFMLGGGLGLFLYGMKMLGDGLEKAAGSRMKRLLEILTSNRIMGILVGIIVTAIIQSSSATTVMVVGFVNTGLMNLAQATGDYSGCQYRNHINWPNSRVGIDRVRTYCCVYRSGTNFVC